MSHIVGFHLCVQNQESPEMESSLWCPWSGVGWGGTNEEGLPMGQDLLGMPNFSEERDWQWL